MIKAIILSAGKGTRIREINKEVPKVLIKILDEPMLKRNIDLLKKYGIKQIAINTHWLAHQIKDYLGTGKDFGVEINYSYEPSLLGTSGSLNNFRDFFDDTFLVVYGDVISEINLTNLIDFHKKNKAAATLIVHKSSHPEDSDIIKLNDSKRISKIIHNPGNSGFGDLGSAAFYVVEPIIFNYLPKGESDFMQDIFPAMLKAGEKIYGYETNEFIKDAGTSKRLGEVQQYLKNKELMNKNDNL